MVLSRPTYDCGVTFGELEELDEIEEAVLSLRVESVGEVY
jgi:hypothetical protein